MSLLETILRKIRDMKKGCAHRFKQRRWREADGTAMIATRCEGGCGWHDSGPVIHPGADETWDSGGWEPLS